jgi:hypothetical protein
MTDEPRRTIGCMDLLSTAAQKSVALLRENATPYGFRAAAENTEKPEYSFLFGRDGSLCALCLLDYPDAQLATTAVKTIEALRDARSKLGQVPFRTDLSTGYRDFWFPGNLDSTLWWTLAALKLVQMRPKLKESWQRDIELSLTWLRYQDVAETGLLSQGQRSDWADELPNHGAVLYTNALWYKVISEAIATLGSSDLINSAYREQTYQSFNSVFWPYDQEKKGDAHPNKAVKRAIEWARTDLVWQPYYVSYLSRRAYGRRCDVLGNILALMFGLADTEKEDAIVRYLLSIKASDPFPMRSLYPVIYPGEPEWQEGMASRNQNVPHQYHNGGIWPFIGGIWVAYLAGSRATARVGAQAHHKNYITTQFVQAEIEKLARANELNDWEFNEYLHGQFGTPMGIRRQSWNAATFLLAHQAVVAGKHLFHDISKPVSRKSKPLRAGPIDASGGFLHRVQRKFVSK